MYSTFSISWFLMRPSFHLGNTNLSPEMNKGKWSQAECCCCRFSSTIKIIFKVINLLWIQPLFSISNGNRILKHLSSTPHETSNTLYKFLDCTTDILVKNTYCVLWLKTWTESYANDLPVTDKTFWKVLCIFNHIYLRISCGIYLSIGKKMKQEFYRYICIDKNTVLKIWKLH